MRRILTSWPLLVGAGISLGQAGCAPEGEQVIPAEQIAPDPCQSGEADLTDGIQDGDEVRAVFDCVNHGGQFDAFIPLLDAMQTARISDGDTTVLDMWVNILNEKLDSASGGVTLNTADLVATLEDTIATLEQDWLPDMIELAGDALELGLGEAAIPALGKIVAPIVNLQNSNRYDAWIGALLEVICPDLEAEGQCTGSAQQLTRGLHDARLTYGTDEYPFGGWQSTAALLAGLFAPAGGSTDLNQSLNRSLGVGLARMASGDFLVNTLSRDIPALYGDDPDTPQLEGYETYNVNQSALYGILALMGSTAIDPETGMTALEETKAELNAISPLLTNYYVWSPSNTRGQTGPPPSGTCEPQDSTDFAKANPAFYGLDQILRMMKGIDVDYTESSLCEITIDTALATLPTLFGTGFYEIELPNTTNLATLILALFAQLPTEDVVELTDDGSYVGSVYTAVNSTCGTNILLDDYEALQASVHITEVIEPTLELLAAVNHAGQMEALVRMVIGLYDTHGLCEAQDWLAQALRPGGPLASAIDDEAPLLPGGAWHDRIMVPLLQTLTRLEGHNGELLVPPIASGLSGAGEELGDLLTAVGRLALAAQEEAKNGGTPALYRLDEVFKAQAEADPYYQSLTNTARTLEEQVILTGLLETLATPEVQDALVVSTDGSQTPVQYLSEVVNSGALLDMLELLHTLLVQLDEQIKAPSSGEKSGN